MICMIYIYIYIIFNEYYIYMMMYGKVILDGGNMGELQLIPRGQNIETEEVQDIEEWWALSGWIYLWLSNG